MQSIKDSNNITRDLVKKLADDIQGKMDKQLAALKKEQEKQKLAEEVRLTRFILSYSLG